MDFCDYIAHKIHGTLKKSIDESMFVTKVDKPKLDLHPTKGWFISSKKTIDVVDRNGRRYKVTVEAVED